MGSVSPERSVGQYLLLERIGAGGLGDVYRARDTRLGRTVAVKLVPERLTEDSWRRQRLLEAARAAAALSHPSIAALFEAGEADGRIYLAFEFVPGQTLRRMAMDGPLHPRRAVTFAIQVADALAEGHAAGIVHRDLKPDNVMVTPKDSAKVLDFGLASWTAGGMAREMASAGMEPEAPMVAATVAYLSPEQAQARPADGRSDIFSLGVVLYEMLTGRSPFAARTAAATVAAIVQGEPRRPRAAAPHVTEELDAIVLRALAKDPDARYASAAMLSADLRRVFGERTEFSR